jgi:hypothetical protein
MNNGRALNTALIVLLHLALLWALTRPVAQRAERDGRTWIQWLRPVAPKPEVVVRPQPAAPLTRIPVLRQPAPAADASPPSAQTAPPVTAQSPAQPPPAQAADDHALFAEAPVPGKLPPDVLQQALKSVGEIDRQLRAENPQAPSAPADSSSARLAKGIAAAHAAVKPKWFEAARTELISPANDPNRIYRVTTALGEYCLYYPDKNGAIGSARSGRANLGEPRVAPCPVPF